MEIKKCVCAGESPMNKACRVLHILIPFYHCTFIDVKNRCPSFMKKWIPTPTIFHTITMPFITISIIIYILNFKDNHVHFIPVKVYLVPVCKMCSDYQVFQFLQPVKIVNKCDQPPADNSSADVNQIITGIQQDLGLLYNGKYIPLFHIWFRNYSFTKG